MDYNKNIGEYVSKGSIDEKKLNKKPFKSGKLINTVKGIINHPRLNIPAYTFVEDDSYVECRRCIVIEKYDDDDLPNEIIITAVQDEFILDFCPICFQMTNHIGDECQKCKN